MTKEEFYVLNDIYQRSVGRNTSGKDLFWLGLQSRRGQILSALRGKGYVTGDYVLTESGKAALEPYAVKNAVILAAGAATRFVPLALEQPKGLFKVKGEVLIERQIRQLLEAGIGDITVVLGYKKEMFFYLKEKYGVHFVFNSLYGRKNNIESLYLVRDKLTNTYVCSCDDYFIENPFQRYEYECFYAGMDVTDKIKEMYVKTDGTGRITEMLKGEEAGAIILGHSFWTEPFSRKFIELATSDREVGAYDSSFWEILVKDRLLEFPPMYLKKYQKESIFEFDYFEELRAFDEKYVNHPESRILENIKQVFGCTDGQIVDFRIVREGLTNTSFLFKIDGTDYIYRYPGEGTKEIISRANEKRSLELAKALNIDPTYIHMDVEGGWKISRFVHSFREPEYPSFEDTKKILAVLRKLHGARVKTDYFFLPYEDSLRLEGLLKAKEVDFSPFEGLKADIRRLYERTVGDGVEKCFCHGDTYKHNWMIQPDGAVILIDWEYAGFGDPGIDVGYYIVDGQYSFDEAEQIIREYCGESYSPTMYFHYMAYTAIIAYYWFVWALYRESCGAVIGESLYNWYRAAKNFSEFLLKKD